MSKLKLRILQFPVFKFSTIYGDETHVLTDSTYFIMPSLGEKIYLPGIENARAIVDIYYNYEQAEVTLYYGEPSEYSAIIKRPRLNSTLIGVTKKPASKKRPAKRKAKK